MSNSELRKNFRALFPAKIYGNSLGIYIPREESILESVYFVFPKILLPFMKTATFAGGNMGTLDSVSRTGIREISQFPMHSHKKYNEINDKFEHIHDVDVIGDYVVVQPRFFGRKNMYFPLYKCFFCLSDLRTYLSFGIDLLSEVIRNLEGKIFVGLSYLGLPDHDDKEELLALDCVFHEKYPNYLMFREGIMAFKNLDMRMETPWSPMFSPSRNNSLNIPILNDADLEKKKTNGKYVEFDSLIPKNYQIKVRRERMTFKDK